MPLCKKCREFISQVDDGSLAVEVMVQSDVPVRLEDLLPYDWREADHG